MSAFRPKRVKMTIYGSSSVGKTSIVNCMKLLAEKRDKSQSKQHEKMSTTSTKDNNNDNKKENIDKKNINDLQLPPTRPTIGIDYCVIPINNNYGNYMELMLWDTAGQERFDALTRVYSRGSDIMIYVFALNDRKSFEKVKDIYFNHKKEGVFKQDTFSNTPEPIRFLFGNKKDLISETEKIESYYILFQEEILNFVQEGFLYYEQTSAIKFEFQMEKFLEEISLYYNREQLQQRMTTMNSSSVSSNLPPPIIIIENNSNNQQKNRKFYCCS